ncbi:MAG TPA: glycosyltransferase family 4 protein [Candidatus Acidoferrales bacterium]|jgi:glycosyltransferase involved in cell wall biosynthesis|nr:glycosyltransferase family 4 protein [Candidatus Acidoferrales bacterium]
MFKNVASVGEVIENLSVCMITCWYHNISMANYSENLIKALARREVSVKVVTSHCVCKKNYRGSSALFDGEYCLVTTPFDSYADVAFRAKFRGLVYRASRIPLGSLYAKKCEGSDILHYQQSSIFSFGELPLLTLLLQTKAPPKVVTIHDLYVERLYRRGHPLRHLLRVYRYADALIVHSEQHKKLLTHDGIPEDKMHVVFIGSQDVNLRGLVRTRIAFFGSPVGYKGFFNLLKALRILRDEGTRIILEVRGIYGKDAEETARKEAERINVADQIQWCGALSELEFDEKMQECLFTFAMYEEPVWGSSLITRAMMNGTPVIATPLGGSLEYLGEAGVYVSPNDPGALASAIRSLLENEKLRENLGKKVRKRALQHLSWDAIAEKTLQIYQSVMDA